MFQNFQFHFHCWVISKNVLIKTQKPQLCYSPDSLVVKCCNFQAMSNAHTGLNPAWTRFFSTFFSLPVILWKVVLRFVTGFKYRQSHIVVSSYYNNCQCRQENIRMTSKKSECHQQRLTMIHIQQYSTSITNGQPNACKCCSHYFKATFFLLRMRSVKK